jgi:hypothetical protein
MPIKAVATPEAPEAGRRAGVAKADGRDAALAPMIAEIRATGIATRHSRGPHRPRHFDSTRA